MRSPILEYLPRPQDGAIYVLELPITYKDTDGDIMDTDLDEVRNSILLLGGELYRIEVQGNETYHVRCYLPILDDREAS